MAVGIDKATVARIVGQRAVEPITSKTFQEMHDLRSAMGPAFDSMRYGSTYFRIETVGTVNDVHRGIVETVKRGSTGLRPQITRVTWFPNAVPRSLTSQPPSDFLPTLPPLGGSG